MFKRPPATHGHRQWHICTIHPARFAFRFTDLFKPEKGGFSSEVLCSANAEEGPPSGRLLSRRLLGNRTKRCAQRPGPARAAARRATASHLEQVCSVELPTATVSNPCTAFSLTVDRELQGFSLKTSTHFHTWGPSSESPNHPACFWTVGGNWGIWENPTVTGRTCKFHRCYETTVRLC